MVTFPGNEVWPSLGLGTWRMGESAARRGAEIAAVRAAVETGYRVVDSAEMYGEGGAEEVVGRAITECLRAGTVGRDELFIVSKVYPHNASAAGTVAACERSLKRLGLDRIDCYLLHWRGSVPLAETVGAFEALRERGRIRHWGVSNFDLDDMEELLGVEGGERCSSNQIYYSLTTRGPGFSLLPWQAGRGIVTMAYSPIDQGELLRNPALRKIAARKSVTPAQFALAWLSAQAGVMALPKSTDLVRLRENFESASMTLEADDLTALDKAFPPPRRKTPLTLR